MSLWHTCSWGETERIVTSPVNAMGRATTIPIDAMDAFERLIWGITSIVMTCSACGDKKVVEIKGQAPKGTLK